MSKLSKYVKVRRAPARKAFNKWVKQHNEKKVIIEEEGEQAVLKRVNSIVKG